MAQKTKATMPGRQCSTENKEPNKHTRPVAGGQSVSTMHFCILGTAPMAQLNHNMLISKQSSNLSLVALVSSKIVGLIPGAEGTALQHTQYFPQWGECELIAGALILRTSFRVAQMQLGTYPQLWGNSNIECRGQRNFAPAVFTHDFGDLTYTKNVGQTPDLESALPSGSSLVFLRWRRLISPRTAALINWPVLSPGSLNFSIPSISSWAILAVTDCDFEFFGPVAISKLHYNWCKTIYTKTRVLKVLTCKTPLIYLVSYTLPCSGAETAKPGSGGTLTGPLTKPLVEVTIMAELQHTQTHPKFTWLFLATPKHYPECAPVVLRFDADTEANARIAFPGWELVFAAKIRAQAPCRVAFFDYNTRRGWAFDSASDREVVGHD